MTFTRKLINKSEKKISYLQIIGFILIFLGVIYFLGRALYDLYHIKDVPPPNLTAEEVSIMFFITMLGFSLAFPDLLKDQNKGLSTMRLVVFMMINVICMLLLKIGWSHTDFGSIGINQYWVGIIAFVFGAKAVQSFFESGMANNNTNSSLRASDSEIESNDYSLADEKIIAEAIKEKGQDWVNSFPNVSGLSIGSKVINGKETKDVALIFKVLKKKADLDYGDIPDSIIYKAKNGNEYKIITDVLQENLTVAHTNIKRDDIPFPLGNSISRQYDMSTGSIGLVIKKDNDPDNNYIVSCYHVLCAPELQNHNKKFIGKDESAKLRCASFGDKGTNYIGYVVTGEMNTNNDFAIAKIETGITVDTGMLTFKAVPDSFGYVFPENKGDKLTMCGTTSGVKTGVVKSYHSSQTIAYCNGDVTQYIDGLIEVTNFSDGGDSGGLVINSSNKIIGLIVAGNAQSSYVLPIQNYLLQNNYSL